MGNLLTVTDIQNFAPELDLSAYSATTISGMISQAQSRAASFCSVTGFELAQETNERGRALIDNTGTLIISVRRKPIVSVASITLEKGGFSTALTLNGSNNSPMYQVPYPGNRIHFPNSYFYATGTYLAGGSTQLLSLKGAKLFYNITYSGGYDPLAAQNTNWNFPTTAPAVPDDLKLALIDYFRDIWSKRNNPAGLSGFTQGSYQEQYSSNAEGKSRIIQEAEDLLMNGDYNRVEIF